VAPRAAFRRGDKGLGVLMTGTVELAELPEALERWLAGR
jgi:hypothetical protein